MKFKNSSGSLRRRFISFVFTYQFEKVDMWNGVLPMKDEWTDLVNFLQEMIEKYYSSLDLDHDDIDIIAAK